MTATYIVSDVEHYLSVILATSSKSSNILMNVLYQKKVFHLHVYIGGIALICRLYQISYRYEPINANV